MNRSEPTDENKSPDGEEDAREYAKQMKARNEEWKEKWPHYCTKCGGWGLFIYTQKHDEGPGELMQDPCDGNSTPSYCHRCGKQGLTQDGDGPCSECKWNFDDGLLEEW